jgi:hypothetical protein
LGTSCRYVAIALLLFWRKHPGNLSQMFAICFAKNRNAICFAILALRSRLGRVGLLGSAVGVGSWRSVLLFSKCDLLCSSASLSRSRTKPVRSQQPVKRKEPVV